MTAFGNPFNWDGGGKWASGEVAKRRQMADER